MPLFLDVRMFSVPTISLIQKATKLRVAKQESSDLQILTNVLIILFILVLFQK
jgi:hypothetical protein